jgi:hypothetical protein
MDYIDTKMLDQLLHSKRGKILISIIWGLGLACIFRKVCVNNSCVIYKPPISNYIISNIYTHDGKCYKFYTETTSCNNKNIIE